MPVLAPRNPPGEDRNSPGGFTVLEIVVVMVLMSVITAVVLGRSITTTEVDVAGQTDKIRNHLRFAQSVAMKRSDTVWGIQFAGDRYWYFSGTNPVLNLITLPGGEYSGGDSYIKYADLGVSIGVAGLPAGTVYFDHIGKPYTAYTDAATNTPLGLPGATITVSAGGESRGIGIVPETGLIQ